MAATGSICGCNSLPVDDTCLPATFAGPCSMDTTLFKHLQRTSDVVATASIYGCKATLFMAATDSIYGCNSLPVGDTRFVDGYLGTFALDATVCCSVL